MQVGTDNRWKKVCTLKNSTYVYGLKNDGSLWWWGNGRDLTPLHIATGNSYLDIGCVKDSAFAIKNDHTLWLINGDLPQQIGMENGYADLSDGFGSFVLMRKIDHTLWGMLNNEFGVLDQPLTLFPTELTPRMP